MSHDAITLRFIRKVIFILIIDIFANDYDIFSPRILFRRWAIFSVLDDMPISQRCRRRSAAATSSWLKLSGLQWYRYDIGHFFRVEAILFILIWDIIKKPFLFGSEKIFLPLLFI